MLLPRRLYADDNFFSTFTYPLKSGDPHPFTLGTNLATSEKMAADLFPGQNLIGKRVFIDNWIELKVASVFENVPMNSTHRFDFVLPMATFRKLRGLNEQRAWDNFFVETYSKQKLLWNRQPSATRSTAPILNRPA